MGETLDRLVAAAADNPEASFADLVESAGLDRARDFVGAPLVGLDLRGEDLRGFDFTGADLRRADLRGADLTGVSLTGADTAGALGLPRRLKRTARRPDPPFDLEEAKRMILAGIAPPEIWVPSIDRLDFVGTSLRDLEPLAGLTALKVLLLSETQVEDLTPLARLSALQRLSFANTRVIDLAPLAGLTDLYWIDCLHTHVSDVSPLGGLVNLSLLVLEDTDVTDCSPLDHLPDLRIVGRPRRRRHGFPQDDPFGIGTMARGILRGVSAAIRPSRGRSSRGKSG